MKFCLIMVMGLGLGCDGGDRTAAVREFCEVSQTITASRRDTPETLAQVRAANAKRRALCGWKNPG